MKTMTKYFRIKEIDYATFERMTGEKLGYFEQVSVLADDGTVYLASKGDRRDYIEIDLEMFESEVKEE